MIHLVQQTYVCSDCGWQHEQKAHVLVRPWMYGVFSPGEVLESQNRAELTAALQQHETACPARAKVAP